ncbi:MAG: MBL fold metallo-hydrolase [Hyphomicrobiales bacterium]|nr:MBL fold metallo-hydrolase [Hyphomicrobiales bacterium]
MADAPLTFDRAFDPRHGERVELSPLVARVTARNPGPFTFHGTNTFLVGRDEVAVIDPGPDDPAHVAAILAAVGAGRVTAILVTHTHRDHSPAAKALKAATGAPVYGEGPHRPARPLDIGEINPMDASSETDFVPDRRLGDGEAVRGAGWTLEAVATPGHTANHLCFALREENALFTGDHVMAWSTSIVAPPDGAMVDFMASLRRLMARGDRRLLPAHGETIDDPLPFLKGLEAHRLGREASFLAALEGVEKTIPEMVAAIYADVDPRLHGAAALSLFAHAEDLAARGRIEPVEGRVALGARWRLIA